MRKKNGGKLDQKEKLKNFEKRGEWAAKKNQETVLLNANIDEGKMGFN